MISRNGTNWHYWKTIIIRFSVMKLDFFKKVCFSFAISTRLVNQNANYKLQADHAAFGGIALSLVFGPHVG